MLPIGDGTFAVPACCAPDALSPWFRPRGKLCPGRPRRENALMKIAVLDDFQDAARGTADWSGLDVTFFNDNVMGEALVARLRPFAGVVLIRERSRFPRGLLEQLPNLRLIATVGMRNAAIDLAACRARGIAVTGTEGGGAPTAELAFGLILALSRNIVAEDRSLRAGTWQSRHIGSVVRGKTLGLVGLGKLGAEVARMGQAFGMDCQAWSTNLTPERAQQAGCRAVDKATLFGSSDYISLHLVLGERSRGIVGAADIAAMRPTACLVNTSRTGLLDEAALTLALTSGRIGGAALDVFAVEPLPPGAPILSAPNTILTPHLGYATRENYASYFPQVVECIQAWQSGAVIRPLH
jgi:phosphoglycerate dehydrogenase-like enzyme